jgi:putative membrane protein
MRCRKIFEQRRNEIAAYIERVESKTSAEIVCAVADESGRYDRAESLVGFAFALSLLVAIQSIMGWAAAPGDWSTTDLSLGWQVPILIIGFVVGNVAASFWQPLRRIVTSESEMTVEADRAASVVFTQASVGSTSNQCGLLIYLSIFEKRVVLKADQEVLNALGADRIRQLCDSAIDEIKGGRIQSVFEVLLGQIEEELAQNLPADRKLSGNELANHLLFADRF